MVKILGQLRKVNQVRSGRHKYYLSDVKVDRYKVKHVICVCVCVCPGGDPAEFSYRCGPPWMRLGVIKAEFRSFDGVNLVLYRDMIIKLLLSVLRIEALSSLQELNKISAKLIGMWPI